MHGDIGGIPLVSGAKPDIVGSHKAALNRKMHLEVVLVDTRLYLA
jgi:hypothetical protein